MRARVSAAALALPRLILSGWVAREPASLALALTPGARATSWNDLRNDSQGEMRRLFLSVDLEGVSAVASREALMPGRWEWEAARSWMTAEAVAAAEATLEGGYDEVVL